MKTILILFLLGYQNTTPVNTFCDRHKMTHQESMQYTKDVYNAIVVSHLSSDEARLLYCPQKYKTAK
jgi:hypothetical protein